MAKTRSPYALPDDHLAAIVVEAMARQMYAEDNTMREKMAGMRCQSCERLMPVPPSNPGMRHCKRCGGSDG